MASKITAQNIKINPRFEGLLRPLTKDERDRLSNDVFKHGTMDPLKYWVSDENIAYLIDGHNRFSIAQDEGTLSDLKFEEMSFMSEDDAAAWILDHQMARRNLTADERALYLGELLELRKKKRGGAKTKGTAEGSTAEQIAKEQGVSPRTVAKGAEVKRAFDAADETLQKKFKSGEISKEELIAAIKNDPSKQQVKNAKKDPLHDDVTRGIKLIADRFLKAVRAIRSAPDDLQLLLEAHGLSIDAFAPGLIGMQSKLKKEEQSAESLTTLVKCQSLNHKEGKKCKVCHDQLYITNDMHEAMADQFAAEKEKAKKARAAAKSGE